jgi:hypothetical protein
MWHQYIKATTDLSQTMGENEAIEYAVHFRLKDPTDA